MPENDAQKRLIPWWAYCHGNGLSSGGYLCKGYRDSEWPCDKCCERNRLHISAGADETNENEFPVEVTVYTRTHTEKGANTFVRICNVREDSIAVEVRNGIRTLVFESVVTDRIGYVPFVEWYTTDVQTRIMDY